MKGRIVLAILLVLSVVAVPKAATAMGACGTSLDHSLTLTQDWNGPTPCSAADDGLHITKSGVTFDLGGFTMFGTNTAHSGIHLDPGVKNVTIKNGTIRGFSNGDGIQADDHNSHVTISGLVVAANLRGMLLSGNSDTVKRSVATDNLGGVGFGVSGAHAVIDRDVATFNVVGITVSGSNMSVLRSVAASNTGNGLTVNGTGKVIANMATGNTGDGFYLGGPLLVSNNRALGNSSYGIGGISHGETLKHNRADGNASGIATSTFNATIEGNETSGNKFDGIYVESGLPNQGNNVISHNRSEGNGRYGIWQVLSLHDTIVANDVRGNGSDGIHWNSGSGQATKNLVVGNGFGTGTVDGNGAGIDATGATVTGRDNTAQANDHRDCVQASLCRHPGTSISPNNPQPTCGNPISVPVKLTGDVGPCAGSGPTINANNVTLDLNGFSILGTGPGTGIAIGTMRNVHILNGTIKGFDIGVSSDFPPGTNSRVRLDGVLISGCGSWAASIAGRGGKTSSNAFVDNGYGVQVSNSVATGNVASGNTSEGFGNNNGTIVSNVSVHNEYGISNEGGPSRNNVIAHNTGSGIGVGDGSITGNLVVASGISPGTQSPGISAGGSSDVIGNIAVNNVGEGFDLSGGVDVVKNNIAVGNPNGGIRNASPNTVASGNKVLGNGPTGDGLQITAAGAKISGNEAYANLDNGISDSSSAAASVTGNSASGNASDGLYIPNAASGIVSSNIANGNGYSGFGYGIEASGNVSGTNTAIGNHDGSCTPPDIC